jgi:hypothetical protein
MIPAIVFPCVNPLPLALAPWIMAMMPSTKPPMGTSNATHAPIMPHTNEDFAAPLPGIPALY